MKKIHTLFILDRSSSMSPHTSRTLESLNSNLATLRVEAKKTGIQAFNTLMTFASSGAGWPNARRDPAQLERDFVFVRTTANVDGIADLTAAEYVPHGNTPLLDAIGCGVEKLKELIGDEIGSDDVSVLVTVQTDGEENSSVEYDRNMIKKMIEHLSSDGKWTFTFVGCGGIDAVTNVSTSLGISVANTVAHAANDFGFKDAYASVGTSYSNYVRAVSTDTLETTKLFAESQ